MNSAAKHQEAKNAAKRIYQDYLDVMSDAVMACDLDTIARHHTLPFRMVTQSQDFVIETAADLLECARLLHKRLIGAGTDNYIRLVSDATFLNDDYIEGAHVTHTLNKASSVVPSYQNRMVLVRSDGIWRVSVLRSGITNTRWPITTPQVDVTQHPKLSKHDPDGELAAINTTPLAIYQTYLDALSETSMTRDFDGWCALCDFPHSVHMDHFDELIANPAEIKPFFDMLDRLITDGNVDDLSRKAQHAEFLNPKEICGYHRTHLYSKGEVKLGPVLSRYILHRTGTTWRMRSVTNSVSNQTFPYDLPQISTDLISLRDIQKRNTRR